MAYRVIHYSSLQSNSSLLNLVLLNMKWSLPYPARPKIKLKASSHLRKYEFKVFDIVHSNDHNFGSSGLISNGRKLGRQHKQ